MFVPIKPFEPSLMFASKAGALLSYSLTQKCRARLERLARHIRSRTLVNHCCEKFNILAPDLKVTIFFSYVTVGGTK